MPASPDAAPIQRTPGNSRRQPDRPLVLVCGHAAGKTLFGAERCLIDTLRGLAKARIDAVVTLPGPP
ncbi:MAG: hypothetical protein AAGI34_15365, partial [Pseudomonadota bacterium]